MIKRSFVILGLALLVSMAGVVTVEAQTVWMDPALLPLPGIGASGDIVVRINGFDQLSGVELYLVYDGDLVNVTANPSLGACPPPDLVVLRDFNNDWDAATIGSQGTARYSVANIMTPECDTVANPDPEVTTVNFQRVAGGVAAITFNLTLGDPLAGEPSVSIATNGAAPLCDASTPGCFQGAITDIPVELMKLTIE